MDETAQTARFTDGEGYEKFMGQWSRAAGRLFLEWLSVSNGLKWLDVGCGTGASTETIQQNCSPAEIVAIDPSAAQVSYAQSRKAAEGVQFQVADARSIPFENGKFDVAVSALVLNFIPDREEAVAEMRRVVRPRGTVAAYVWDFAGGSGTAQHLNSAVKELEGPAYRPAGLNPESTSQESLKALFEATCLTGVETRPIKIPVTFRDFDDYWNSNTGFASPVSTVLKSLTANQQQQIKQLVKAKLPIDDQGAILYSATVNAVRGYA